MRKVLTGGALVLGLALHSWLPAPALAQEFTIKAVFLANKDDEDYDGLMVFKDYVEAQSKGRIAVEIYPGGQLCGNPQECLEGLQGGILEVFLTTFGGFGNIMPEAQVMDLPYMFESDRVAECALANDSEFFAFLRDKTLEQTGVIRLMTIGNTGGWRNFATIDTQIKEPADVEGLKIRTISSELQQQLVQEFGGSPTNIAWPEVYTSLATGVVQGTKNGITDIVGMKFHEHLNHITLDGHAYMGAMWMMNNDVLMSMPEDLRMIVADGFNALRWTTIVFPKRRQIEAYEAFEESGSIYVPNEEERQKFKEAAQPLYQWYKDNYDEEWLNVLQSSIDTCEKEIEEQYRSILN